MMNQKKIDLLKKLKNLAEQGVGGEKETAQKKLKQLMQKYNVEEEELSDDTEEKYEFTFHGEFERRLLLQVGYKILGKKIKKKMYEYKKRRWKENDQNNRMHKSGGVTNSYRARILLRLMEGGTRLFLRMLYPKTPDIYRRQ